MRAVLEAVILLVLICALALIIVMRPKYIADTCTGICGDRDAVAEYSMGIPWTCTCRDR